MANSTTKSEIVISCNTQQPKSAVRAMEKELKRLETAYKQLSDAGKAGTERAKNMAHDIKELSIAVKEGKANMDKIVKVTNDLSNSSLRQLNQALRQVKKEMQRTSTDSSKLNDLRAKYKAISDQIKILQGDMVNIKKHIGDLSNTSDNWLSRAINQQKQLVGSLNKTEAAYNQQLNTLHKLQNEQAQRALTTIKTPDASAESLRAARANLVAYRDQLGAGGIMPATGNVASEIARINVELKKIDDLLDKINGKEKQVEQTTQQVQQMADKIILDPKKFSPKEIKAAIDEIQKKLNMLSTSDPARARLGQSMKQLQGILDGVDRELVDIGRLLQPGNLKKASLETLQRAAKQLEGEIAKADRNLASFTAKQKQLAMIRHEIESTTSRVNEQVSAWKKVGANIGGYMILTKVFHELASKLHDVIRLNLQMSDQLADIRKVSGLAIEDINRLNVNLAKIDTRTTIQELNQIAYAGAKLGIGKWGTEGLEQFTRAANKVNVALKEDLGADALTALSKITEVMGLIPKMGIEKSMLATGSAMFQLSATSTATSNNIVEFSKRLTGMARTAGITTDQLLALGSAADSMYLMPEVASTAFNKFISALQKNHNLIEKQLQIEPGTISQLYSAGKIVDAMVLVFEKMRDKGNMNVMQDLFKDLGSDGARLVNVMVTMSKNVDMLKDHLYTSAEAFEEATAVTNEYNIQQETANALMERASNVWEKAFINPTGVDYVKSMAEQWYNLSLALTSSSWYMGQIKVTLLMLWGIVKVGLALLPMLLQYLMFRGAAAAVMGLVNGFKAMRTAIIAATAAQQGLNTAMKANIFGLIASVIAGALVYLVDWCKSTEETADATRSLKEYTDEAARAFDNEKRKLDSYLHVLKDANTSQEQRERIIKRFNHEYQPYLTKLGIEVKSVNDLQGAYEALNAEIKKKMYYQLRERAYTDKLGEAAGGVENATLNYSKYVNRDGSDFRAFDTKWLQSQVDAGKNVEDIYRDMMEATYGKGGVWSGYNGDYIINNKSKKDSGLKARIADFVNANKNYNTTKKDIDDAFDPIIGDYDPFKDDDLGELERDAVDKAALKKQKAEEAARRKALRAEMKDEQAKAKAIIDNVKNYYERQIAAITEIATKTNMSEEWQTKMVDGMKSRMNDALGEVRKAIAGTENEWASFRETMIQDLYEPLGDDGTNQSTQLLDNIVHNDIEKLKAMIATLSKELGQNGSVLLDQIWRKATENQLAKVNQENKTAQNRRKVLLENDYTGKVNRDYQNDMEQLGVADLSAGQTQQLMEWSQQGNKAEIQKMVDERTKLWQEAFANARKNLVDVLAADVSQEGGQKTMLTLLFGPDYETRLSGSALQTMLKMDLEQWQVFYQKLIEMADAYTEAEKKTHQREKKVNDFRWERTPEFKANEDAQKYNEMLTSGVGQFSADVQQRKEGGERVPRNDQYGTASFISSMGHDPEIDSYRLKMEAAAAYYDFLKAHQADAESMRDAEQSVLKSEMEYAKAVAAQMKQRMDDIYALAAPVEEFGTSIGKAFATMTEDAEAGRAAVKAAIGDMINGFMEQTVKMTEEWIKRRLMQQMNDRLTSVAMKETADEQVQIEKEKQDGITDAQQKGGDSKQSIFKKMGRGFIGLFRKQKKTEVGLEEEKQDAIMDVQEEKGEAQELLNADVKTDIMKVTGEIGSQTVQMEQQQAQSEVQTEAGKTQANTAMGIASGASKIIGSLGWWGIPLIAVITALLNGLLSFAMGKVSSLFGGGDSGSDSGPTAKLVTGMLTYDSGNAQSFAAGGSLATRSASGVGDTSPVLGTDGKVYQARQVNDLQTGIVTEPIATLINGQPSLVAEKGPEMVIGRETTAAMQMNHPELLRTIVSLDKHYSAGHAYRTYDSGNLDELGDLAGDGTAMGNQPTAEDIQSLRDTMAEFAAVMLAIKQSGLHVNKYGRGGVVESAASGSRFMRKNSGDRLWNE